MSEERYSEEAAREILKRAVDLQGLDRDFSRQQLLEMADELGISPDALAKAEQGWMAEQGTLEERRAEEAERRTFERERRRGYYSHLATYLIINTFLFFINLISSPGEFWFFYPLLGWGIGLAFHTWSTFQSDGDEYEEEFIKWRATREIKQKVYRKLSS